MASLRDRIRDSWNVFTGKDLVVSSYKGYGSWSRPDRVRFTRGNKQSIVASVYNQIAIDCAAIKINHSRVDDNGKYIETINDELNKVLNLEANLDQTGRAFIQDVVMSMLDEGHVAIVPIVTDRDPCLDVYKIYSMRTGKITEWFPDSVRVDLYNEMTGKHQEKILPKRYVAIVENPLYAVMNEPNSTLQRLIRKMNLLDSIDEQTNSGKLDLIIQLPYVIKSEIRKKEAEKRRAQIEEQLSGSKYGIAYTDGTEKITQLNRSLDNNLLAQIKDLTSTLYSQLGLTEAIFNGTADEATMINYHNRTIEPIISAIVDEMKRKFLTETARSQNQSITYYRDPFKLAPVEKIANVADTFTRNEIFSSNEVRALVGYRPINDERADQLRNKNLNAQMDGQPPMTTKPAYSEDASQEEYPEEQVDPLSLPLSEITYAGY